MKTSRHFFKSSGLLLTLTIAALAFAGNALANTAANHLIRNTVTVNYNDAGGTPQTAVTASVDITVLLVEQTPTLSAPADGSTTAAAAEDYTYTLTANANGPDIYTLAVDSITESAGVSGSTATFLQAGVAIPGDQLTLGASTVATAGNIAAAGNTVITVPSDDANDGSVNGIIAGDTVVINGKSFVVFAVNDANGGTANTTSTITVIGNGTLEPIAVSTLIAERQEFTLRVTPGTVTATTDQTIDVVISATNGATAAATDATQTTILVAALTVTKEVSVNGGAFVASANAVPGDTLTYRITVYNGGTASATTVVITDPLAPFTTYVALSAKASSVNGDAYATAPTTFTDLADADAYDFTALQANYNVGTIPTLEYRLLFFQVTVD